MEDNLPLVPGKEAIPPVGDARRILRTVFHVATTPKPPTLQSDYLGSESCVKLKSHESLLRRERAEPICKDLPSVNHDAGGDTAREQDAVQALHPTDLMISTPCHALDDTCRLIKAAVIERQGLEKIAQARVPYGCPVPAGLDTPNRQCYRSEISPSLGEVVVSNNTLSAKSFKVMRPQDSTIPFASSLEASIPTPLICIPHEVNLINFTVKIIHERVVRLVNVSQKEVRVAPKVQIETDVSATLRVRLAEGARLVVTSGASIELVVQVTLLTPRPLKAALRLALSTGHVMLVPINAFMQPPSLDLSICRNDSIGEVCEGVCKDAVVLSFGAQLLGRKLCAGLLLRSEHSHAAFWFLTEDQYNAYTLQISANSSEEQWLHAEGWAVTPHAWRGGGLVKGAVTLIATQAGLHVLALHLLSSTGTTRAITLLADVVVYEPDHVTLESEQRMADIDSCEEDDSCECYVHLGVAFPKQSLNKTLILTNHSPVWHRCRWREVSHPHRTCSLTETSSNSIDHEVKKRIEVKSANCLAPRSTSDVRLTIPNAGEQEGTHRAKLELIIEDIPVASISPDYICEIISETENNEEDESLNERRISCVCLRLEVVWEVSAPRVVLTPPVMKLSHSTRVDAVGIHLRANQLGSAGVVEIEWRVPPDCQKLPPSCLRPTHSLSQLINLPVAGSTVPQLDTIEIVDWDTRCLVISSAAARHPRVTVERRALQVLPPGAPIAVPVTIFNDTYQHITWSCKPVWWYGHGADKLTCAGGEHCSPCPREREGCACAALLPKQGESSHGESTQLMYRDIAPENDCCVLTLAHCERADVDQEWKSATGGRAALLAYRVLAPRLVLRTQTGDEYSGSAVIRGWVRLGKSVKYTISISNITPTEAVLRWRARDDANDDLQVTFEPKQCLIAAYASVSIQVDVQGKQVCARRLWVYAADVTYMKRPLYLILDFSVEGIAVEFEIPVGVIGAGNECIAVLRLTQSDKYEKWNSFEDEDQRREQQRESLANLPRFPVHAAPTPPPVLCLQFTSLAYKSPSERLLRVRNISDVDVSWSASVRRHSSGDRGVLVTCSPAVGTLREGGKKKICVQACADTWGLYMDQIVINVDGLTPIVLDVWLEASFTPLFMPIAAAHPFNTDQEPTLWLTRGETRVLRVQNTARCAVTIKAYLSEPSLEQRLPLRVYLRIFDAAFTSTPDTTSLCPCPTFVESTSSSSSFIEEKDPVAMELYLGPDHGPQLFRHYTMAPEECVLGAGKWMEWRVTLPSLPAMPAPPATLILRTASHDKCSGDGWFRVEPCLQTVQLRCTSRGAKLELSARKVTVNISALMLQLNETLRVRKRFRIRNAGNGSVCVRVRLWSNVEAEWCAWHVVRGVGHVLCGAGCQCDEYAAPKRSHGARIKLSPRSSTEILLEVSLGTVACSPPDDGEGNRRRSHKQILQVAKCEDYEEGVNESEDDAYFDQDNVLLMLPLVCRVQYPTLKLSPASTQITVRPLTYAFAHVLLSHDSADEAINVGVTVSGKGWSVDSPTVSVMPRTSVMLRLRFLAPVCGGSRMEGEVTAAALCDAGAWCRAQVPLRAIVSHDARVPRHTLRDDDVVY